jgi:hypothetical protein
MEYLNIIRREKQINNLPRRRSRRPWPSRPRKPSSNSFEEHQKGAGDRLLSRGGLQANKRPLPIFPQSKLTSGEEWGATKTAWPQGEWKMSEWWCPASGQNRRTQKTPRSTVDSDSTRWGWFSLVAVDLSKISIVCFRSELMVTWSLYKRNDFEANEQTHIFRWSWGSPWC